MSWYVFVTLVLVLVIGAAILVAMWLEHRNPPPSG
jgi:predicted outer membrane lipoprotein